MYKIYVGGELLTITDHLRYVRRNEKGVFVECPREKAHGIAVKGQFYRFINVEMEGYPVASFASVDAGNFVEEHRDGIALLNDDMTNAQIAIAETFEAGLVTSDEVTTSQIGIAEAFEYTLMLEETVMELMARVEVLEAMVGGSEAE